MRSLQAGKRLSAQASLTKEPPRWPRARAGRCEGRASRPGHRGPRPARAPGAPFPAAAMPRVPVAGQGRRVEGRAGDWRAGGVAGEEGGFLVGTSNKSWHKQKGCLRKKDPCFSYTLNGSKLLNKKLHRFQPKRNFA